MTDERTIPRLQASDADQMARLRKEAITSAPLAFGSSPDDDRFSSTEAVHRVLTEGNQAIFGLFVGDRLQGMVGSYNSLTSKECHKVFIWGMYVCPRVRGQGGGTQLLAAAVDWARNMPCVLQVHLSVTGSAPEASRLYEKAGFVEWGVEPRALQWQGEFTVERHLVLFLPAQ